MGGGKAGIGARFVVAVLAASLVALPVGYLLYGVLFAGLFAEGAVTISGVMRESPGIPWVVAGQIAFATLVALIVRWRGATSLGGGARTGAILGFLMAVGYDFAQYGTTNLWTLTATLIDPAISAALVAVTGAVAGVVLGAGRRTGSRHTGTEVR